MSTVQVVEWAVTNLPTTASPSSLHTPVRLPLPHSLFNLPSPCSSSFLFFPLQLRSTSVRNSVFGTLQTQCPRGSSSSPPYDPRSSSSEGPLITISTTGPSASPPPSGLSFDIANPPHRHPYRQQKKSPRPCGLSPPLTLLHPTAPLSSRRPVIGLQPLARHLGSSVTRPITVAISSSISPSPPCTRPCPTASALSSQIFDRSGPRRPVHRPQ